MPFRSNASPLYGMTTTLPTFGIFVSTSRILREAIEFLAAVTVRIGGEQHFRRDLAEAVDHALRAEIRRARRPHRAERRRRQHRDDGFGNVRQESRDAITDAHARFAQRMRELADFLVQFGVGEFALVSPLVARQQRDAIVLEAQQILREVQADVRRTISRPASCRHRRAPRRNRRRRGCRRIPRRTSRIFPDGGSRNRTAVRSGGCPRCRSARARNG